MRRHGILGGGMVLLACAAVRAAVFEVDTIDAFQTALTTSQANQQNDTIILAAGAYTVEDLGGGLLTYTAATNPVEDCSLAIRCTNGMAVIYGSFSQVLRIKAYVPGQLTTNADVTIEGVTFREGALYDPADVGAGLFAWTQNSDITIEDCQFVSNRTSHLFYTVNAAGAFLKADGNGTLTVRRCRFTGNTADGSGGGLYIVGSGGGTVVLENNVFSGNEGSGQGGGAYISAGATLTLRHNTFAANRNVGWASYCHGGGVHVSLYSDGSEVTLQNNVAWSNTVSGGQGADIFLEDDTNDNGTGAVLTVVCNDYGDLDWEIGDHVTMAGNLSVPPGFADPSRGDYTLTAGSPCVDTGTNLAAVTNDLDGIPRPLDGDTNGVAAWDMGAHEYPDPSVDTDGDGMPDGWEVRNGLNPLLDDAAGNADADGLTNLGEYQNGTNPRDADTDDDTLSDGWEVANGYNPLLPDGGIRGAVSYGGGQTGPVVVVLFDDPDLWDDPVATVALEGPGNYAVSNLYAGTYYVAAVLLTDPVPTWVGMNPCDPWGFYVSWSNVVGVTVGPTQCVTGVDVALEDGGPGRLNPFASGVTGDFDGDGKADPALFRRATGKIWALESWSNNVFATAGGNTNWVPAAADFDGDGRTDPAWFIPATTVWRIYESSRGYAERLPRASIGSSADVPIPADFDGDGRADLTVFLGGTGKIRHIASSTSNQHTSVAGAAAWLPAVGDYDGDRKADYSWFIPSSKVWRIYPSSSNYAERLPRVTIGGSSDVPLPGADFDGDGKSDMAVFRRTSGKIWVRYSSLNYTNLVSTAMGMPTWLPAVGDCDGDGRADFSWFIPSTQMWRVYESSNGYAERLPRVKFGGANDWPLATPLLGW